MNEPKPDRGLRPKLPAECRTALADALVGADGPVARHLAECAGCRQRLESARRLAAPLRQRPEAPAELRSPALREGVYERIVAAAETGPLRRLVEARPSPVAGAEQVHWPDAVAGDAARRLVGAPEAPDAAVWERVRATIVADLRSPAMVRSRRHWLLGLVGVAAAALVAAAILATASPAPPKIVFIDLQRMPDLDFAVIRHGLPK